MDHRDDAARQDEAALLAQIGRSLFDQDLRIQVRLPTSLAMAALQAWQRDDTTEPTSDESPTERRAREQAGIVALIGLAVEECSSADSADTVIVELDAWQIGSALDAADERGLLAGLNPRQPKP